MIYFEKNIYNSYRVKIGIEGKLIIYKNKRSYLTFILPHYNIPIGVFINDKRGILNEKRYSLHD